MEGGEVRLMELTAATRRVTDERRRVHTVHPHVATDHPLRT